jgi:hypothetical protein
LGQFLGEFVLWDSIQSLAAFVPRATELAGVEAREGKFKANGKKRLVSSCSRKFTCHTEIYSTTELRKYFVPVVCTRPFIHPPGGMIYSHILHAIDLE